MQANMAMANIEIRTAVCFIWNNVLLFRYIRYLGIVGADRCIYLTGMINILWNLNATD